MQKNKITDLNGGSFSDDLKWQSALLNGRKILFHLHTKAVIGLTCLPACMETSYGIGGPLVFKP